MNILIADDHNLFRNGLKMLLGAIPDFQITGEASTGIQVLELIRCNPYDIVLLDIEMPEMNGIDTAREALKLKPDLKIITLTMYGDEEYLDQMEKAGAKGFLLKNSDLEEVKAAINVVEKGGTYYSQELMQVLLHRHRKEKETKISELDFTEREREILFCICNGLNNQQIGTQLFISKRTVEKHRANLLTKTNSKNTADLVIFAVKNQLFRI